MKKLMNLNGAKMLSKSEQKSINGGIVKKICCDPALTCCTPQGVCGSTGDPNCQYWYSTGCCI